MKIKRIIAAALIGAGLLGAGTLTACSSDAETVNHNLDKDADNFKVLRRVVFYNAMLDKVVLEVEGYCSVDPGDGRRMSVVCKVGNDYKRNALGQGSGMHMAWWYEQLETAGVSPNHYKFIVKPSLLVPEVEGR